MLWNVSRLAECFAELAEQKDLSLALSGFDDAFNGALNAALSRRLGIAPQDARRLELGLHLFPALHQADVGFETFFFDTYGGRQAVRRDIAHISYGDTPLAQIVADLATCEPAPHITPHHAYFQGQAPCTMLIDEVETIWSAIADRDDWSDLKTKLSAIDDMRIAYATA